MRSLLFIIFIASNFLCVGQQNLEGTWKGVLIQAGKTINDGIVLYADFELNGETLAGHMREEIYESKNYAIKRIKGSAKSLTLEFDQFVVIRSTKVARMKWCRYSGKLIYNQETGRMIEDLNAEFDGSSSSKRSFDGASDPFGDY